MFQSLEQFPTYVRVPFLKFFHVTLNLRQLELTPPPHLFITPLRLCVPFYVRVHAEDAICISFYVKQ